MSNRITWHSACMVAILFCAMLEPSQSQGCSTEKTENATIDLKVALSRGIRGADPVHVASWEACVNFCCFGRSISGNKKCNLVIFKPQKRGNSPNCYLFHCPTMEACPMKQAVGLVTYRTIKAFFEFCTLNCHFGSDCEAGPYRLKSPFNATFCVYSTLAPKNPLKEPCKIHSRALAMQTEIDAEVPKPTSSLNKSPDLIVNGSFVSPKAVALDTSGPTTPPTALGPSQKVLTPKMMKTLLGQVEKPVDKIHRHSHPPEGEGTNASERSDSLPTHQTIHSLTPTNTPQNLLPNTLSTVKLPAVTPSTETRSVFTVPPSNASSTGHATADYMNTYGATVSPRRSSPAPQPTATSQAKASILSLPPPSLSKRVSSPALPEAHLSHGQLSGDRDALNGAPGEKYTPYWGDKSVLLAALLFGVIFLLLAQVVIGRKLLESLRHRRYSRLDYLINGMYANT